MRRLLLSAGLTLALAGCSGRPRPLARVYLLMDTSGTYTKELHNAQAIINAILAEAEPGDSIRGCPRRHRQLQREGHRRPRDLRRAAVRDQPAEAQVPRPDRRLREGRAARGRTPTSPAACCRRSST